ncbi:hypothetical protein GPJ56_005063 [Histomonas meleagridis]|uniref:uncharacterized protein n=1 Tax=Histomonas meleagridis TaxID=135588 RepID=UPI00355951A5|nr:hypothetical protein GPJ56_005063 [Histomonas meleagridis]KAH0802580.1 hypothetical protein GO595_004629 [Histomonas meleagridis]
MDGSNGFFSDFDFDGNLIFRDQSSDDFFSIREKNNTFPREENAPPQEESVTAPIKHVSDSKRKRRNPYHHNPKFDYKSSNIYQVFKENGWDKLVFSDVSKIGKMFSDYLQKDLSRDAKREKTHLFKWFEDNFEEIQPLIPYVEIIYEEISITVCLNITIP